MTFMLSGVTGTVALWYFYHRISKLIEFLLSEPIKNAFETATRPSALGKLACRTQDVILTDQESKREIEKSYGKLTKWRQRPHFGGHFLGFQTNWAPDNWALDNYALWPKCQGPKWTVGPRKCTNCTIPETKHYIKNTVQTQMLPSDNYVP